MTDDCSTTCTDYKVSTAIKLDTKYHQIFQNGDLCEPDSFRNYNCMNDHMNSCQNLTCKFITMENPALYPWLQGSTTTS